MYKINNFFTKGANRWLTMGDLCLPRSSKRPAGTWRLFNWQMVCASFLWFRVCLKMERSFTQATWIFKEWVDKCDGCCQLKEGGGEEKQWRQGGESGLRLLLAVVLRIQHHHHHHHYRPTFYHVIKNDYREEDSLLSLQLLWISLALLTPSLRGKLKEPTAKCRLTPNFLFLLFKLSVSPNKISVQEFQQLHILFNE